MVTQRILQKLYVLGRSLLIAMMLLLLGSTAQATPDDAGSPADRDEFHISTIPLDLRSGDATTRGPSADAFLDALGMYGEFELPADPELHATLLRRPYSAIFTQGRASLDAAILSFGTLDCPQTKERAERAILDLAAAAVAGMDARQDLRMAYLYLFLCADRSGQPDEATAAAKSLRQFTNGERPKEIGLDTWSKYPTLDTQSNQQLVPVDVDSDPTGADILLDFQSAGQTPGTHYLSAGQHVLAIGKDGRALSQLVTVTSKDRISLTLPPQDLRWTGLATSIDRARAAEGDERPKAMTSLMAATEADLAFVLREPGRIAVWIAPSNRRSAELVGHAPNAEIAGRLALQGLRDAQRAPGLDPNFPLLRETPTKATSASSTRRWWIYGAVLGAAAIAAGVIIAQDLSEDRQRIEVILP